MNTTTHKDPVCGMQVNEETAADNSVFEGNHYYFCSAGCKKKFDAKRYYC